MASRYELASSLDLWGIGAYVAGSVGNESEPGIWEAVANFATNKAPENKKKAKAAILDGIFVDIGNPSNVWTEAQWRTNIQAMKDVGMTFFVVPHTARGVGNATADCPSGTFHANFPPGGDMRTECFTEIGAVNETGGTLGVIVRAAAALNMKVHLGLSLQTELTNSHVYPWFNITRLRDFAWNQWLIAQRLWALYGDTGAVAGFYTEIEPVKRLQNTILD